MESLFGINPTRAKRPLIPAYKDMDPYDPLEEFSHLQPLDMSKLGFMQDLDPWIQKLKPEREQEDDTVTSGVTVNSFVKTCAHFLKMKIGRPQMNTREKAMDMDPEFSDAYIGKLFGILSL